MSINKSPNLVIDENGTLLRFQGCPEKISIPHNVKSISYNVFDHCSVSDTKIILSVDYFSFKFCKKKGLDYEEKNQSFFALLSYLSFSRKNEEVELNIFGDVVDSEFEDVDDKDALVKIKTLLFNDATTLCENMLLDLKGVRNIKIPKTVIEIYPGFCRIIPAVNFSEKRIFGTQHIEVERENPYYASDNNGCLYTKDMKTLLCVPSAQVGNGKYEISHHVQTIANRAFENCFYINRLYVPEHVIFEPGSLVGAANLKEIHIASDSAFCTGSLSLSSGAAFYAPVTASLCAEHCCLTGSSFIIEENYPLTKNSPTQTLI